MYLIFLLGHGNDTREYIYIIEMTCKISGITKGEKDS